LVKSEDLNHHQTLFAGRCAEWFVEAGFIAVASVLPPRNVVCVKIHGFTFSSPAEPGEIVRFESKIVQTGRSSVKVYITLNRKKEQNPIVSGFITFVHVNQAGQPIPHQLTLEVSNPEDVRLNQIAGELT